MPAAAVSQSIDSANGATAPASAASPPDSRSRGSSANDASRTIPKAAAANRRADMAHLEANANIQPAGVTRSLRRAAHHNNQRAISTFGRDAPDPPSTLNHPPSSAPRALS